MVMTDLEGLTYRQPRHVLPRLKSMYPRLDQDVRLEDTTKTNRGFVTERLTVHVALRRH